MRIIEYKSITENNLIEQLSMLCSSLPRDQMLQVFNLTHQPQFLLISLEYLFCKFSQLKILCFYLLGDGIEFIYLRNCFCYIYVNQIQLSFQVIIAIDICL